MRARVLRNAKGSCEACKTAAPFKTEDGQPFLEVHHVVPLADGGPDMTSNAVAVCPNCHRKLHLSRDREAARAFLYERLSRLVPIACKFK